MTRWFYKQPKSLRRRLSRWLVARSRLFDARYYLEEYSDVAAAGVDPLTHYCDHGWREARRPGPLVHPEYVSRGPIGRHFSRFNPITVWSVIGRWVGWSLGWPQLRGWAAPPQSMKADVAFVLHAATRTGAPVVALRLARWMRLNGAANPIFILLGDGPLLPELWDEFACLPLFAMIKSERRDFLQSVLPSAGIVYLNSLASLHAWKWLDWHEGGLLLHVHESAASMDQYAEELAAIAAARPRAIAVNESCRAPLARILGRDPDIVPPAIELAKADAKPHPQTARKVVVGCGTMSRRKGADLFCEVAALVLKRFGEVEFRWIGGSGDVDMKGMLENCGIAEQVKLTGEVADPLPELAAGHLLLLPSRDDPFPLVALEAASCGVPTICFDVLADGVGTWISRGAGEMVPAFDVSAMADAVIRMLTDPLWHGSASTASREAARYFDIDAVGRRIELIIKQAAQEKSGC